MAEVWYDPRKIYPFFGLFVGFDLNCCANSVRLQVISKFSKTSNKAMTSSSLVFIGLIGKH